MLNQIFFCMVLDFNFIFYQLNFSYIIIKHTHLINFQCKFTLIQHYQSQLSYTVNRSSQSMYHFNFQAISSMLIKILFNLAIFIFLEGLMLINDVRFVFFINYDQAIKYHTNCKINFIMKVIFINYVNNFIKYYKNYCLSFYVILNQSLMQYVFLF